MGRRRQSAGRRKRNGWDWRDDRPRRARPEYNDGDDELDNEDLEEELEEEEFEEDEGDEG